VGPTADRCRSQREDPSTPVVGDDLDVYAAVSAATVEDPHGGSGLEAAGALNRYVMLERPQDTCAGRSG
jgi:hypothetical protein